MMIPVRERNFFWKYSTEFFKGDKFPAFNVLMEMMMRVTDNQYQFLFWFLYLVDSRLVVFDNLNIFEMGQTLYGLLMVP